MSYIWLAGILLVLALACPPASGFKPYCDCLDMGGHWVAERELYENGEPTDQSTREEMDLQVKGCSVTGTFGSGGSISGSFAGGVASNLVGIWSNGGEEGNFNIQLLDRDKDCASFEGWMTKEWGKREWRWTGSKGSTSTPHSCDGKCRDRDPHLIWNGKDEYPYCNCVCEDGWEFDASGKICVPSGTSATNPCGAECRGRDPHLIWNGKDDYPYCNCVCEDGWEFDASGKTCVQAGAPDGDATGILLTTPQGTSAIRPGDKVQVTLAKGQSVSLEVFCRELDKKIKLMEAIFGGSAGEQLRMSMADISLAMGFLNAEKILCRNRTSYDMASYDMASYDMASYDMASYDMASYDMASYDIAPSDSEGDPSLKIEIELRKGPLRLEIADELVSLKIETPTAIIFSHGANAFEVSHDPTIGRSEIVARQHPVEVHPKGGNQAPFTLASGEWAKVGGDESGYSDPYGQTSGSEATGTPGHVPEDSEGGLGGCYADPSTGEIVCVDSYGEPEANEEEAQGGCYQDPETGIYVCID